MNSPQGETEPKQIGDETQDSTEIKMNSALQHGVQVLCVIDSIQR